MAISQINNNGEKKKKKKKNLPADFFHALRSFLTNSSWEEVLVRCRAPWFWKKVDENEKRDFVGLPPVLERLAWRS